MADNLCFGQEQAHALAVFALVESLVKTKQLIAMTRQIYAWPLSSTVSATELLIINVSKCTFNNLFDERYLMAFDKD